MEGINGMLTPSTFHCSSGFFSFPGFFGFFCFFSLFSFFCFPTIDHRPSTIDRFSGF